MATFTHVSTIVGGSLTHLDGISSLEILQTSDGIYLYTGSQADGGLNSFLLAENQTAQFCAELGAATDTGTTGLTSLTAINFQNQALLIPSGRYDDQMATHVMGANGTFEQIVTHNNPVTLLENYTETITINVGPRNFLFSSQADQGGLQSFRIKGNLDLKYKGEYQDDSTQYLGDISAFASVKYGKRKFLFVASDMDAGVSSFGVTKNGNLNNFDNVTPGEGSGFSHPTALEAVTINKSAFLLMGAAGTSSITVFRIGKRGQLIETDYLLDTTESRFQNVTEIETFSWNGRVFVLAAGSDDGITLFELDIVGGLHVITSLADQMNTTLNNVSGIEVFVLGSETQVFVTSATEEGITQFSLDLGNIAPMQKGNNKANTLIGGDADDILIGLGGGDTLNGGAGDDRLIDGTGKDFLTGGVGADVFVFIQDAKNDVILDFEIGVDKIDMSDFAMLYHISGLTITSWESGAMIRFANENIRVTSADGNPLTASDFSQDDFIF